MLFVCPLQSQTLDVPTVRKKHHSKVMQYMYLPTQSIDWWGIGKLCGAPPLEGLAKWAKTVGVN